MVLLISWVDVPIGGNVRTAILDGSNTSLDEARARRQRHDSIVFLSLQADGQKRLRRSHRKRMNPLAKIFGFRWSPRYTFWAAYLRWSTAAAQRGAQQLGRKLHAPEDFSKSGVR